MNYSDYLVAFLLENKNYILEIDIDKILDPALKDLARVVLEKDTNDLVLLSALTPYSIETLQKIQKLDLTNVDFKSVLNNIYLQYYKFHLSRALLDLENVKSLEDFNDFYTKIQNIVGEVEKTKFSDEEYLDSKGIIEKFEAKKEAFSKKRSFGLSALDDLCTNPLEPEEITIFFGQRGIGKSAVVKNIEIFLLRNKIPVLSLNLEMSFRSLISRYFSIMSGIDFYKISYNLIEKKELESLYEEFLNFKLLFGNNNFLSMHELNRLIQHAKEKFGEDYLVVTIDSIDMVQDFDSPDKIKKNMDRLHAIAKKHKVHIIAITQANENKIRYQRVRDGANFTFSKYDIYGSSYYSARARLVILVNRPNFINKELGLPYDMLQEDILQLKVVKQNDGDLGEVLYEFNPRNFRIGNPINYRGPITNFEILGMEESL